ncbi:MAG: M28 family peptidase [Xanthobacteraceae bacterium]
MDGRAVRNIEITIEPANAGTSRGTVVLGAHYDSYGDAPGANDNGTGTAAVLELARLLSDLRSRSATRIRLVRSSTRSRRTSRPPTWAAIATPACWRSAASRSSA